MEPETKLENGTEGFIFKNYQESMLPRTIVVMVLMPGSGGHFARNVSVWHVYFGLVRGLLTVQISQAIEHRGVLIVS